MLNVNLSYVLPTAAALLGLWGFSARSRAQARANEFKKLNPKIPVQVVWVDVFFFRLLVTVGIIPKSWFEKITGQGFSNWERQDTMYREAGAPALAIAMPGKLVVTVGDAELCKEVFRRGNDFPKPVENYKLIDIFGKNIVSLEGHEWRRHRKIVAPRFGERNNMLVHEQTARTAKLMFQSWETSEERSEDGREFTAEVTRGMLKLALHVISSAGFGRELNWEDDEDHSNTQSTTKNLKNGHTMTFVRSLEIAVNRMGLYLLAPKFLYTFPIPALKETEEGMREFQSYLLEYIRSNDATSTTKDNLLTSLVAAAKSEGAGSTLTESELLGNTFVFMFAGHETTAGTLQFALALLAFHPEYKQKLHDEVDRLLKGETPTYKQSSELVYTLAVMNETLRLFPPATIIPKSTDTIQSVALKSGTIVFPPKTMVNLHVGAIHRSDAWGPDAREFRPDRWLKDSADSSPVKHVATDINASASDDPSPLRKPVPGSFVPFSDGPRACIGRKFAQVEFVCAMALIAQRYDWRPVEGATEEETMKSHSQITLRPDHPIKLTFRRRE